MSIEFDEAKNLANIAKHGISLSMAYAFDFDNAVIDPDVRKDYGETRFIAIGFLGIRLHVLIFTSRREKLRIISLRKANPKEKEKYAQRKKI